MTTQQSMWRVLRDVAATSVVLGAFGAVAPACLNRPIEPVEPRTTSTIVDRLTQSAVDKIDILLMLDNSGSMADKQSTLKAAVPNLVSALVNPHCLAEDGKFTPDTSPMGCGVTQPCGPLDACPVMGTKREFDPILNMHVGVVTSSLGNHGSDSCIGDKVPSENDHGHLIHRGSTDGSVPDVKTWSNKGFLVWDPNTTKPTHNPPGESNSKTFNDSVAAMVSGAGEVGCGFENQLEGWYRFAVDPDPYNTVTVDAKTGQAVLAGTDMVLKQQRADFIRPDSLFAIVMLTDENDCSVRDGSQYFFAVQRYKPGTTSPYHLPKPRAACASDPNSACCRSCGQAAGPGCDASQDGCTDAMMKLISVPPDQDAINLRCFDQKRRFGIDFLQPIQRYVDGLTRQLIADRYGNVVPNPLFSDLNPSDDDGNIRDPGLVFMAGIVGVPWQDIARKNAGADGKFGTADDKPDLVNGINSQEPDEVSGMKPPSGGFQSGSELQANKTWDIVLGGNSDCRDKCTALQTSIDALQGCIDAPGTSDLCKATDPLMFEGTAPRTGSNPVTGDALSPPVNQNGPNAINGHEWKNSGNNDLQYACIFDLPKQVDCATLPADANCDCKDAMNVDLKPLCDPAKPTLQVRAKAYPGRRELQTLKALVDQGITASICPVQQTDATKKDYGYNPAVGAIVERLKKALGGQCLPRTLRPDHTGAVPCFILEARVAASAGECNAACSQPPRQPLSDSDPAVKAAKADPLYNSLHWNCFCKILPALGEDLKACQAQNKDPVINMTTNKQVDGWCYIDATTVPPTGNVDIVAKCPASEKRLIRFVGKGAAATGATTFITCEGE